MNLGMHNPINTEEILKLQFQLITFFNLCKALKSTPTEQKQKK